MPVYRNPYLNRVMIRDADAFYGRRKEVARIFSRIGTSPPQCTSVVGDRRIGKSSLLHHISQRSVRERCLEDASRYAFVFMDFQERRSIELPDFFRSLFGLLREEMEGGDSIEASPDYGGFRSVLSHLNREGIRLVLVLDEFESITRNSNFGADFFAFLRSMANTQEIAYVTSSARNLQELCHTQEIADSPFFNIFSNLHLGPFVRRDAVELIEKPSAQAGIPLGEYADTILQMAGYFPFFLQIACSAFFDHVSEREGKSADLDEVKEAYLEEAGMHFQYIWEQCDPDQRSLCWDVVEGRGIPLERERVLRALMRSGYIVEEEGGYRIFSSVFEEWMRERVLREAPEVPVEQEGKEGAGEERKLTAVMFTDIKDFSRKMGQDEGATIRMLREHDEIILPLVEQYGGRVVKTVGDRVMGDFGSVVNAVECARRIQEELGRHNASREGEERVQVRIGIHLGDVLVSGGDLFGDGVNVAARLEEMAEAGGIYISAAVYNQIKNRKEIRVEALGAHRLKNIAEPVYVFRVVVTEKEGRKRGGGILSLLRRVFGG